jgi:hypothetical protein
MTGPRVLARDERPLAPLLESVSGLDAAIEGALEDATWGVKTC